MEVQISERQKIVVSMIDYGGPEGGHIDIRQHFLQGLKEKAKNKETGQMETVTIDTWCRASQGLQIPVADWPAFVKAVGAIKV